MLETLDYTIRIGSTPTILYFDLYLYSAYAAHYVYSHRPFCNILPFWIFSAFKTTTLIRPDFFWYRSEMYNSPLSRDGVDGSSTSSAIVGRDSRASCCTGTEIV